MIRINDRNGSLELVCPMCVVSVPYPLEGYECELKDGRLTVTNKHPDKDENPHRIDLREAHGPNCDFVLVDAPVEVITVKTPVNNSSQTAREEQVSHG